MLLLQFLVSDIIELDLMLSIESKHEVTILSGLNEFMVKFFGPISSEYITFYSDWNITVSLCMDRSVFVHHVS